MIINAMKSSTMKMTLLTGGKNKSFRQGLFALSATAAPELPNPFGDIGANFAPGQISIDCGRWARMALRGKSITTAPPRT